jgi:hypothetical protein
MRFLALSSSLLALAGGLGARAAWADAVPADKLPEPAIAAKGVEGDYLQRIHNQVHRRWAENFLRLAAEKLPLANPVNDPTRVAVADVILSADGQIVSVEISRSGGFLGFDDAVKEVLHDSVPFAPAPVELRSDDEAVHLRWTFARDERRCSSVALLRAEQPMPLAMPKLFRDRREAEALRRLRAARAAGTPVEPMMTSVAATWLKAAISRPEATVRVADALVRLGDAAGTKWLKLAVKRPELAAAAGQALAARHVPVCPLVGAVFNAGPRFANLSEQHMAAIALATAGEVECAPGLIALLQNPKARPDARAAAAVALGPVPGDPAKKALAAVMKDDATPVAVRAAATLAAARPGSGRGKVLSLVTPLRDPAPEMRAAAAAGIVRAGGDANLDDLYVVFKDSDPRPAEAVALELDSLKTEAATALLVRLLKRPHLSVQLAAARALIKRGAKDSYAALRPFMDAKADPELRGLALVSAEASTLDNLGRTLAANPNSDPKVARLALATFRARLARDERDAAADLFINVGGKLSPGDQADAMADWLTTGGTLTAAATTPPAAGGGAPNATAAVTRTRR